ncbi:MAG: VWA domain-containing protein [Clostridiales bacterium]|jgi:uncharacterized protein YegL|nr:VWA domain-containing protein [Clostridiales bacterium]
MTGFRKLLYVVLIASFITPWIYVVPTAADPTDAFPDSYTILLLDVSGSMSSGNKITKLKEATRLFVETAIEKNSNNRVALVAYGVGSGSYITQNNSGFTDKVEELQTFVDSLYAYGNTPTDAAFKLADEILTGSALSTALIIPDTAVKNVVLLTDGIPNDVTSAKNAYNNMISNNSGVNAFALGIDSAGYANFMNSVNNRGYYNIISYDGNQLYDLFLSILGSGSSVTYNLTIKTSGNGVLASGTDVNNDGKKRSGDKIKLSAVPNSGESFIKWTATAGVIEDETAAETNFTMPPSDAVVTAVFTTNTSTAYVTNAPGMPKPPKSYNTTNTIPSPTPQITGQIPPYNPNVNTYNGNTLENVHDKASAVAAVQNAIDNLSASDKSRPESIYTLQLYVDEAASQAASAYNESGLIYINEQTVNPLLQNSKDTLQALNGVLTQNGVEEQRDQRKIVNFKTHHNKGLRIVVEPSASFTEVDTVRVETEGYTLAFSREFIETVCAEKDPNRADKDFTAEDPDFLITVSQVDGMNAVDYFPEDSTELPVIVSLPQIEGEKEYQALVDLETNTRLVSIYNDVTGKIEGQDYHGSRLTPELDENIIVNDAANFDDIADLDEDLRKSINQLRTQNVVIGTGGRKFNPNDTINRAEIAVMLAKILKRDTNASTAASSKFIDLPSWENGHIRSLAKVNNPTILAGTSPTTFSPTLPINNIQIAAFVGRALKYRGFKLKGSTSTVLSTYRDSNEFSKSVTDLDNVALTVNKRIIVQSANSLFNPTQPVTRAKAAQILSQLYTVVGQIQ